MKYIYAILNTKTSEIKIGYATNVANRLSSLKRIEGRNLLKLIGYKKLDSVYEPLIHIALSKYKSRKSKEWFYYDRILVKEMISFITDEGKDLKKYLELF